jgi:hypothetical protein
MQLLSPSTVLVSVALRPDHQETVKNQARNAGHGAPRAVLETGDENTRDLGPGSLTRMSNEAGSELQNIPPDRRALRYKKSRASPPPPGAGRPTAASFSQGPI